MGLFNRNCSKLIFTLTCYTTVSFMVVYWLYKYQVDDRDIGEADYVSFKESYDLEYPVASLCFKNPFVEHKLMKLTPEINDTTYLQYLNGDIEGNISENIEYQNISLDLNDYFISGRENWFNGSTFRNISLSIDHVNTFNGFYHAAFMKCFSIRIKNRKYHYIKRLLLFYDKGKLIRDWKNFDVGPEGPEIAYSLHYPGQFLLGNGIFKKAMDMPKVHLIQEIEFMRRRSRHKRKCYSESIPYDTKIFDYHASRTGCRPPYLRTETSAPLCETKEMMKESKFQYAGIKSMDYPVACQIISKMRMQQYGGTRYWFIWRDSKQFPFNSTLTLEIEFPERITIITMSKEIDIHTLIGNIGGYIGLFLGNAKVLIIMI